jgi:hypothetical protein
MPVLPPMAPLLFISKPGGNLPSVYCTIDEFIKGAASLRRYGITFDDNIDVMYMLKFIFFCHKILPGKERTKVLLKLNEIT